MGALADEASEFPSPAKAVPEGRCKTPFILGIPGRRFPKRYTEEYCSFGQKEGRLRKPRSNIRNTMPIKFLSSLSDKVKENGMTPWSPWPRRPRTALHFGTKLACLCLQARMQQQVSISAQVYPQLLTTHHSPASTYRSSSRFQSRNTRHSSASWRRA